VNLRWRSFERNLRRLTRRAIRGSDLLLAEYRRVRGSRWDRMHIPQWFGRLGFIVFGGVVFLTQTPPIQALVAFMVLWTLGSMLLRAGQLGNALYVSPSLNVFQFLPLGDSDIFEIQFREFARAAAWSAADFIILYFVLLSRSHSGLNLIASGLALGLVHGFFIGAGAFCLYVYGPRRFYPLAATLFLGGAIALVFFRLWTSSFCDFIAGLALWIPPLGWTFYALGIAPSYGLLSGLWPSAMAALLLALAPITYRRLRNGYHLTEQMFWVARRVTLGAGSIGLPEWAQRFAGDPAEAASALRRSDYLAGLDWSAMRGVERLIARFFTPREQLVADFLVAGSPAWGKGVRTVIIMLVLGTFIFRVLLSQLDFMVLIWIGVYWSLVGVAWPGLGRPRSGGIQSPLYAVYPLGFWELARVVIKVNLARFLLCAPFALGAILLCVFAHTATSDLAVWVAIKLPIAGILVQPLLFIGMHPPGTNDSQHRRVILPAVLFIVSLVIAAITFIAATTPIVVAISTGVLTLLSFGALATYARLYNRMRFDLVPIPSDTKPQPFS